MATIANAIQITNTTANTFSTINQSVDRSINNIQKKFQFLKLEFNKSIDTKSIDQVTLKLAEISKSLGSVVDNFKELKSQAS